MTAQRILPIDRARWPIFAGVDVGGTSIKVGIVDDNGNTLAYRELETDEVAGPRPAMQAVVAAIDQMMGGVGFSRDRVEAIGLGTPGPQDIPRGMLIQPPNHPHWHNFPIVACLEELSGLRVAFANDANAAAWGEFWLGSGQPSESMALFTLGTGVGGGIIMDARLLVGNNSSCAELGHMIVDGRPNARLCAWGGGRGHLEAYASASAVIDITRERLEDGAESSLNRLDGELTGKAIYEAAVHDDLFALTIIDETAEWLSVGITTIVHTLDPGLVVIGGAMTFGGESSPVGRRFLNHLRNGFKHRSFDHIAGGTEIRFATLGGDAGYLGAAGLAREMVRGGGVKGHLPE